MAVETRRSSFGGCSFSKVSPARGKLAPYTRVVNLVVPFEEALKLNLAVDEALRRLNVSERRGKRSALNLTLHFHTGRITVSETRPVR